MGSGRTWDRGAFLFAKTDCYTVIIGVHCVKPDGWGQLCHEREKHKDFVSPSGSREYDLPFRFLYHQRDG